MDKLFENHSQNVIQYPSPGDDLLGWYTSLQETIGHTPLVRIKNPDRQLSQVCYRAGDSMIFFWVNSSLTRRITFRAHCQVERGLHPWVWDPETGAKFRYSKSPGKKESEFSLAPAASLLVVFEKSREGEEYASPELPADGTEITGPWQLELIHVNGRKRKTTLRRLADFREYRTLKRFAGEAVYSKEIRIENPDIPTLISLGNVHGVSALSLNGQAIGVRWYGDHIYDVSGKLKSGQNNLSVRITTIAGNYLKSQEDNLTARRWTRGQPYQPVGILGPVKLYYPRISE
jgi:hypothetical protein